MEAVAGGFFTSVAEALVPGFLRHATVGTIQHLVALPDPAGWSHVGQLEEEMVFLGGMLLPVTLAAGALRYLLVGVTGATYPSLPLSRCVWVTGVLVAYRWIVAETVAAVNTFTHAILELPTVGDGLARLVAVLFTGALLTGTGGVFGALLVIVGVLFAAGLFAAQVLLTLTLALLVVAGPPLIALSAIPELAHLASAWGRALLAVALVPLGWTVLFATAGALTLDATSFTGGIDGVPSQVAAAFAALITFMLAVRLPWTLLGSVKRLLAPATGGVTGGSSLPPAGAARVAQANARLRAAGVHGTLSLGRSLGLAAGALGAPAGGLAGAAGRRIRQRPPVGGGSARVGGGSPAQAAGSRRGGVRERLGRATVIVRGAPDRSREASARAMNGPGPRRPAPENPDGRPNRSATDPDQKPDRPRRTGGAKSGPPGGSRSQGPAVPARGSQPRPPGNRTLASRPAPPASSQKRQVRSEALSSEPAPVRSKPTGRPRPPVQPPSPPSRPAHPGPRRGGPSSRKPPGAGVPPGGRDPVRPSRARKPDRRPRKGRGK
ncbi:MAG: hypothetical protein ACLQBB_14045 [Solirubrobacteraceae bacterium]